MTSGRSWNYYGDKVNDDANENNKDDYMVDYEKNNTK